MRPAEALDLLGSVRFGRIVFTQHALPAVRVVNHTVVDGEIVIRTHAGAALARSLPGGDTPGVVVAYEADEIDAETHTGWTVVATGYARVLDRATLPAERAARYLDARTPWFPAELSHLVVIRPEIVTGRLLLDPAAP
ncbi:pyridoxamine 5'-phosphate oxidase family protein [Streptacidiphilus melanogenes]|uniref:pyridoxamine 5'-phosphate oxidase family protein n=1 Tax=Streptacidiphilus melanogenes TaxID=411235 RepID=UPI0005A7C3FF|nr:pyridoxamine 5'-phosphate oxidase family protein [Streptacidiphilus melanogenes]